ncbi:extracellular solute-binding protein [Paenibacillus hemerocallicola]|uniref:Extracellular solute-binding protein n=1 Tax=Paenibacillus hemerocallicola TaxID=1172614 RepID=A0A5C4TEI0_9BACL|nr:extracellular solute-binding protein [Paenibacillus hemerocallicola]TNJ67056.1 extracellular solute-binding protein [Paenibacillus hemerocallicola]
MKRCLTAPILLAFVIAFTGCSTNQEAGVATSPQKPPEPVTIRVHQLGAYYTEQDFNELIAEPVKKKYPHITVEMDKTTEDLPVLLTKGETIDFLVTYHGRLSAYKDLGVYLDLLPLAKKYNFDLSRFDQGALDTIIANSDKGELYALPYANNLNALYYNKDIFDKFGVAYPKDGLLWEDTVELAKKLTRLDNQTQYRGLEVDDINRLLFPLSLNIIEEKTDKVTVNSEPYKRAIEIGRQIYSIPGNDFKTGSAIDRFLKDKNVAMITTVNLFLRLRQTPDLNWDVAQFPSYKEKPDTYGMYDLHCMIPMAASKNRDDQMRVLEVLFSDEVQTIMSRKSAKLPVMKDPKYRQAFGQDLPELKGKHIEGVFKSKSAPAPANSIYYAKALSLLNAEYANVVKSTKDVNTALRDAEEQIKQYINTEKINK